MRFREVYWDTTSDINTLALLTLGQDPLGSLAAVGRFNTRLAEPRQRFSYSSAGSLVLGLRWLAPPDARVSDYANEKRWAPLGAEADATWIVDAQGQEITLGYFNAVLRDWARLGLTLTHDSRWLQERHPRRVGACND